VPTKGYNLDFLDKLDDPNFNPFETKSSVTNNFEARDEKTVDNVRRSDTTTDESDVSNKTEEPSQSFKEHSQIEKNKPDFQNKMDDPNFDPFSTNSKISNEEESSSSKVSMIKDSTPEFEQNEANIVSNETSCASQKVESEIIHSETVPTSPPSNSSGYSTLPKSTQEKLSQAMNDSDFSFCVPEPVDLEKWMSEAKDNVQEDQEMSLLTSKDVSLSAKDFKVPANTNLPMSFSLDNTDFKAPADMSSSIVNESINYKDLGSIVNGEVSNLAKLGLLHEARLLDKDKELARLNESVKDKQKEIDQLKLDLQQNTESNKQMMIIVEEFEKTIGQLIAEKEREQVCNEIARDRIQNERNQILEDLQAVERAFNDLHRKYERTKEVVAGFKSNEDTLKKTVEDLSQRYKKGEERYELLKTHAETKLSEANSRIAEIQRSKSAEIAKLTALLKKAEMRVASLERSLEQKTRENQELTTICDELIGKVGS